MTEPSLTSSSFLSECVFMPICQLNLSKAEFKGMYGIEETAAYLYRALGYTVSRLTKPEIAMLTNKFPEIKSAITDRVGRPDLFIYNANGYSFIEVKSGNDGIRISQIQWYLRHKEVRTCINFITFKKSDYGWNICRKSIDKIAITSTV